MYLLCEVKLNTRSSSFLLSRNNSNRNNKSIYEISSHNFEVILHGWNKNKFYKKINK